MIAECKLLIRLSMCLVICFMNALSPIKGIQIISSLSEQPQGTRKALQDTVFWKFFNNKHNLIPLKAKKHICNPIS